VKGQFSRSHGGTIGCPYKKLTLPCISHCIQKNPKMDQLSRPLEETIGKSRGEIPTDVRLARDFLDMIPQAQSIKEKILKVVLI
jgi:hypothetical protein